MMEQLILLKMQAMKIAMINLKFAIQIKTILIRASFPFFFISLKNNKLRGIEECLYYYGEIYFNNIKIEYQGNFTSFYYDDYKAKIISEIN